MINDNIFPEIEYWTFTLLNKLDLSLNVQQTNDSKFVVLAVQVLYNSPDVRLPRRPNTAAPNLAHEKEFDSDTLV